MLIEMFIRHIQGESICDKMSDFLAGCSSSALFPLGFWKKGSGVTGDIGGSGPTREKNARRSTSAFDAVLRWTILCGEVSEQPPASESAGQ
jgi:hypothetical protein